MKINRLFQISFVACLAAICFATVAEAQPPGGGGGQRGGRQRGGQQRGGFGQTRGGGGGAQMMTRAQLLRSEDVQEEIDVDDAQGATITAALEAYQEERNAARPDFSSLRDLSEEDRTEMFSKMRTEAEALSKKTDELLAALLEPEQITRLDQIALQINSKNALAAVLKSEDVRKELSIGDEQVTKLEEVEKAAAEEQTKMREEMRANFSGGRGRGEGGEGEGGERPDMRKIFEEMQKKGEEAREKAAEKIMAVLTADQQASLKKLKGEEFEIDMRSLGRGGQGGRGGDRGGAGGGRGGQGGRGGDRGGDGGGQQRRRPAADSDDAI